MRNITLLFLLLISNHCYANRDSELSVFIENQTGDLGSIGFSYFKWLNNAQGVELNLSLFKDDIFNEYAPSATFGYLHKFGSYNEDLYLNFMSSNTFPSDNSYIPLSQAKVGLIYFGDYIDTLRFRVGAGLSYNISSDVEIDDFGFYINFGVNNVFSRFEKNDGKDSERQDLITENMDIYADNIEFFIEDNVLFSSKFEVNSYHILSDIGMNIEMADYNSIHFKAYYSCSGTLEYNVNLSTKRIDSVRKSMQLDSVDMLNSSYIINNDCVDESEIRVDVIMVDDRTIKL